MATGRPEASASSGMMGVKAFERHQHRQVPIFEGDLGEWVLHR